MTKLEHLHKKVNPSLFLCSGLGAYNLHIQILKVMVENWQRRHFNHLEYEFFYSTSIKIMLEKNINSVY